jgi:hypothetical protein
MTTVGPEDPANSLPRAYRYCLRAYPAWYRLAFGDDLVAVLEESHAGERRPSVRECASLVAAGLGRRVAAARSDKASAGYAFAVTLECVGALSLVATGIRLAIDLWSSSPYPLPQLQNLAFRIGGYQHHLLDLAGYLLLLVVLAVALGLAATRAWERVGTPVLDAIPDDREPTGSVVVMERWSELDAGVLIAQPVIAFMGALALSVRVDAVPPSVGALSKDQASVSTAILVVGLATGFVLIGLMWRRMRLGAPPMGRAAMVTLVLVAVPWIAFGVAGGRFGAPGSNLAWAPVISYGPTAPGGRDLGTGFTTVRLAATGQTEPLSVACSDPAHCVAIGLPWDLSGATSYGAFYSASGGQWQVAPFPITTAQSSTAPFSKNVLTCPGSGTCYALSLNAPQPARLDKSTDGGLRWRPIVLPFKQSEPLSPYGIPGIQAACMSDSACVFAGPQGFAVTLDGGSSWANTTLYSSLPIPVGVPAHGQLNNYLAGVACPAARVCFVTVETVARARGHESSATWLFATHDAGRTWSRRPIGPLTVRTTGLSVPIFVTSSFACADALHCVLVAPADTGGPARVLLTADGGATFSVATAPTAWGQDDITVTCVARLVCWALPLSEGQQEIWRSADGGRHWAEASPLPRGVAFGSAPFRYGGAPPEAGIVACPSAERCVAIGHRLNLGALQPNVFVSTTDGGRSWGVESIPALSPPYRARPPIVD